MKPCPTCGSVRCVDAVPEDTVRVDWQDAVTRLEVIDKSGRTYHASNMLIGLSYQDEGRTLKVFVMPRG